MRAVRSIRVVTCIGLALALSTGIIASVSAQAATPATTPDSGAIMQQMMTMQGACPQGMAATMLQNMQAGMTPEATAAMSSATEMPAATAEATETMGVTCLFGTFSGAAEVPGPGATGAMGVVFVSVDPSSGNICYEEAVTGITLPATMTHIHVNSAGVSGPIVVPFPVAPDATGKAQGCTTVKTPGLAQEIASKPAQYYVNVHTTDFPNGAARAQLSVWNSSMMNSSASSSMMTPEATMSSSAGSTMVTPEASPTTSG